MKLRLLHDNWFLTILHPSIELFGRMTLENKLRVFEETIRDFDIMFSHVFR